MAGLFWRQLWALIRKNIIVLSRHSILNILRCIVLPVAFGLFLAFAQNFLTRPNRYGLGNAAPVQSLSDRMTGSLKLYWVDATSELTSPSPAEIMAFISRGFSPEQSRAVQQLSSSQNVTESCKLNFNGDSSCFAAVLFNNTSNPNDVVYTIRGDVGLIHVNVYDHNGDFQKRILPLQWALDHAIIQLKTNINAPTPSEWPFSHETDQQQSLEIRVRYLQFVNSLFVIAFLVAFIGVVYHLPGSFAGERANLLTSHLRAMGLLDSARILSWIVTLYVAYLPAWVIISIIWSIKIFTLTNFGIILLVNLLIGFSFTSWSMFVAVPFNRSPQLAAVTATFLCIALGIITMVVQTIGNVGNAIFTIIFPPAFSIFAYRCLAGYEQHQVATSFTGSDSQRGINLLSLVIPAVINVFLWPCLAVALEYLLYNPSIPSQGGFLNRIRPQRKGGQPLLPEGIAIVIENLEKKFTSFTLSLRRKTVAAISDLTLAVPKNGIFVLLGANGAGKSTVLSILGGLSAQTKGNVIFEGNLPRPPRGTLGIVPQKNVLFPQLTCLQTLCIWAAVKHSDTSPVNEDLMHVLRDCDLEKKAHCLASTLSGGQKRKLQLAIGLVGGSSLILVDECTSGVDPLSRRSLWRTLSACKDHRTIVFTTHFLDEADFLADEIAILAAPGELRAWGTPVSLKRELGEGYGIQVTFVKDEEGLNSHAMNLLHRIQILAPVTTISSLTPSAAMYHLNVKGTEPVESVLRILDTEGDKLGIQSYDILGTSIEDVFLRVNVESEAKRVSDGSLIKEKLVEANGEKGDSVDSNSEKTELEVFAEVIPSLPPLTLHDGRPVSPFRQALTIFHKRALIAKRSWLAPVLALLVAVLASTVPLIFFKDAPASCVSTVEPTPIVSSLFFPDLVGSQGLLDVYKYRISPPSAVSAFPEFADDIIALPNRQAVISNVTAQYQILWSGGVAFDGSSPLFLYDIDYPTIGPTMLNLLNNVVLNQAVNSTGGGATGPTTIRASYSPFASNETGNLKGLRWAAFFCAGFAVFPAFFALYVIKERRSSVQAMQMSNGLNDVSGMWLGHLLWDSIIPLIAATIIVIAFVVSTDQFQGPGYVWLILVLYGFAGILWAYCVSLLAQSALAAFAIVSIIQVVAFILYFAGYMLILTYASVAQADKFLNILHFVVAIFFPIASVIRTAFISSNIFSLLCDGGQVANPSEFGSLTRFGGPILYLCIQPFVFMAILIWVDSGSILPRHLKKRKTSREAVQRDDVDDEAKAVSESSDILRVLDVTKSFGKKNKVVDNVSFGVGRDNIFGLLGPNGAGKTTTFNVIRGVIIPEEGDVMIDGTSIVHHPKCARISLGVCPQFTAIDPQLTVRQTLMIYGRLKGLNGKTELKEDVDALMKSTALYEYADRLSSRLSGGNQRKLALAIALIGNPSTILIDEFSSGVDAKMKRDMWMVLKSVAANKAVVITTHSMEEASALSQRVGIIAKRMLAVGTVDELCSRFGKYEVHFSCRTRKDVLRAQTIMSRIPGAKLVEDVTTRFEVPVTNEMTLSKLFSLLAREEKENGVDWEFTVEKATLESLFLKVIRENEVEEEDLRGHRWWRLWF